ncbi:hypothetical protein [Halobaculum sp. EA56]
MAAKRPAVGIDHPTVVPTNAPRADDGEATESDSAGEADRDGSDDE